MHDEGLHPNLSPFLEGELLILHIIDYEFTGHQTLDFKTVEDNWWDNGVGWNLQRWMRGNTGTTKPRTIRRNISDRVGTAWRDISDGWLDVCYRELSAGRWSSMVAYTVKIPRHRFLVPWCAGLEILQRWNSCSSPAGLWWVRWGVLQAHYDVVCDACDLSPLRHRQPTLPGDALHIG